jgi:hypothetical protein
MERSEQIGELIKALVGAQSEFQPIVKDANNPAFNKKYADLPAVVKGASPILMAHDLAVTQTIGSDDKGDTLTTMLVHISGQYIADTMRLRPVKNDPQAQGSATSYARRYSYMSILGLVADDDDDGNQASQGAFRQQSRPPSRQQSRPKPQKAHDPNTDAITHNMQPDALKEVKARRQEFMEDIRKHGISLTAVPDSQVETVKSMIEEYSDGAPL